VLVEDMATDRRFTASASARDHGAVSALSVMIESPDEPFGTLAALSTRRRTFSPSDVSFVQAVANVLASAVDRSRAQERLGEVREAERSRIARDLHDEALQDLTDALVQADRGSSAGLAPDAAGRLVSTLKRVGQQLRGAIYDLRISDDVNRPFPEALRALIDVQRAMAVDCELDLDIAPETPIGVLGNRGVEVLRIVGEALTNARRHSGARRIRVTARGSEAGVGVDVTDDGRGFDRADEPSATGGRGIQGMRERAALLGAGLDIRSAPGAGTTVRISLGRPPQSARERGTARILLVEDHAVVRQAIAAMFEHEPDLDVVAQAGSLAQARGMLHDVDVAVLDLGLPDGRGGDLIADLRDVNPRAQALVLSASLEPEEVARAIDSGAADVLDKIADLDEIVDAVRRLHHGAAPPS
jgi:signal transduction histidine kinase/ActR/RegA family two-component response regulator